MPAVRDVRICQLPGRVRVEDLEVRLVQLVGHAAENGLVGPHRPDLVDRDARRLDGRLRAERHSARVLVADALQIRVSREEARHRLLHSGRHPVRVVRADDLDLRVQRLLLALLPGRGQRVARRAAHEGDLARAHVVVHLLGEGLAERARVLADDGRVVLAGAGHVAPRVRGDRDSRVLRLLEHRQVAGRRCPGS